MAVKFFLLLCVKDAIFFLQSQKALSCQVNPRKFDHITEFPSFANKVNENYIKIDIRGAAVDEGRRLIYCGASSTAAPPR